MKKSGKFPKSGGHGGQQRSDGRKPSGGGGKSRPGSSFQAGRAEGGRSEGGRGEGGRPERGRPDSKHGKPFRPGASRPGASRGDSPRGDFQRDESKRADGGRPERGRPDSKHGKPFRAGASRPGSSRGDSPRGDFKRDDFKRDEAGRDDRGRPDSKHGKPFRPGASRPGASRGDSPRGDFKRNDSKRADAGRDDRGRSDSKHGKPFRPGASRPSASRPAETQLDESYFDDFESFAEDIQPVEPRPAQSRPAAANKGATHPGARKSPRDLPPPPFMSTTPVDPRAPKDVAVSRAGEVWLYGHHAVAAAVANPSRKILRLMGTAEALVKLTEASGPLGQARTCSRREIDAVVGADAVHQGIALLTRALEHDLADVLEVAAAKPNACIVVLDQVTDPHNVGAILRSAAAFGASAVIAPDRHAADESGAMAKSASGALDKIPYVKAINLVRALEQIKEHQFWLVGLDAEAEQTLGQIKLDGRIALVLGAEGEGLRRLVRETCDHIAKLPMAGDMESLNVSNAGAIALYEKVRQDSKT